MINRVLKPKKSKNSPFFDKEYYSRLCTRNSALADPECVGQAIEKLLKPRGFNVFGRLGKRDQLVDFSFRDIPSALPLDEVVLVYFVAQGSMLIQLNILWFPPCEFEAFGPQRSRVELGIGFPIGCEYSIAEEMFCAAVEAIKPHWGELNQISATKFPTLCTLDGHYLCVPHLGTTNFFGPEYCEFFGGIEKIDSAGFKQVTPFYNGVLTSLGTDLTVEEYRRSRAEVEAQLAPLGSFETNKSFKMLHFRHEYA